MTHKQSQTQTQKVVLGRNHSRCISELVSGSNFPWFYYPDVHRVNPKHKQEWDIARHSFIHQLWFDDQQVSQYFNLFEPIVYKMADAVDVKCSRILRMQTNMMLNVGKTVHDVEHTDGYLDQETERFKWFTGIYYVNDSDGCTTIEHPDGSKILIEPVADSFVVFNGNTKHSAQLPLKTNTRVVVNVNFLGEQN